MRNYFLIVLFPVLSIFPQINGLHISQDRAPATFKHQSPRLYPNKYNGFTVVWEDFREGEPLFYAQVYDSLNNPVGKNFKINGNEQLYFSPSNFISLNTVTYDPYNMGYDSPTYFEVYGSLYNNQTRLVKSVGLAGGEYPWCGTGYLGTQSEMITSDSSFIFLFMNDGIVSTGRYDYAGNRLSSRLVFDPGSGLRAGRIAADINNNGNYLLAWLNVQGSNLRAGYYGTVFNSKDSIVVANKLLLQFPFDTTRGTDFIWGNLSYIKVKTVSDSLFEVFFIRQDSSKIIYATFDDKGNLIGNVNTFDISFYKSSDINAYYDINSPILVPIQNDFRVGVSVYTHSGL
jgi:hypothetical protein